MFPYNSVPGNVNFALMLFSTADITFCRFETIILLRPRGGMTYKERHGVFGLDTGFIQHLQFIVTLRSGAFANTHCRLHNAIAIS
jgi:hypothetical protein